MNKLQKIRQAVANYMYSEGCSCCRNIDSHAEAKEILGKLLRIQKFKDKSGYDFYRYVSKEKRS